MTRSAVISTNTKKEFDIIIIGGRTIDSESWLNVVYIVPSLIKGKANREVFDVLVFDEIIEEEDGETSSAVVLAFDES